MSSHEQQEGPAGGTPREDMNEEVENVEGPEVEAEAEEPTGGQDEVVVEAGEQHEVEPEVIESKEEEVAEEGKAEEAKEEEEKEVEEAKEEEEQEKASHGEVKGESSSEPEVVEIQHHEEAPTVVVSAEANGADGQTPAAMEAPANVNPLFGNRRLEGLIAKRPKAEELQQKGLLNPQVVLLARLISSFVVGLSFTHSLAAPARRPGQVAGQEHDHRGAQLLLRRQGRARSVVPCVRAGPAAGQ